MRKTALHAGIYLLFGLGCIAGASYVQTKPWHDVLLVVGGILLGGFCAMFVILNLKVKSRKELSKEGDLDLENEPSTKTERYR